MQQKTQGRSTETRTLADEMTTAIKDVGALAFEHGTDAIPALAAMDSVAEIEAKIRIESARQQHAARVAKQEKLENRARELRSALASTELSIAEVEDAAAAVEKKAKELGEAIDTLKIMTLKTHEALRVFPYETIVKFRDLGGCQNFMATIGGILGDAGGAGIRAGKGLMRNTEPLKTIFHKSYVRPLQALEDAVKAAETKCLENTQSL